VVDAPVETLVDDSASVVVLPVSPPDIGAFASQPPSRHTSSKRMPTLIPSAAGDR
jgi:hypothetical protein